MNRDELLDAVVESPSEDGPRLVYADWLLQQENPIDRARGEYISLACSGSPDPERVKKRMKELIDRHEGAWLGSIATLTDARYRHWARGFLESCILDRRAGSPPVESALGHPAWRTLRTLFTQGSNFSVDAQRALLTQSAIARLHALYASQPIVESMAEWSGAPHLGELAIAPYGNPLPGFVPRFRAECFARVRRLHVFGCGPELGCDLARPDLTLIAVSGPEALASWLATLAARDVPLDEVRLVSSIYYRLMRYGIELVVRRAPSGRWSAIEVRWGDTNEARLRDRTIVELGRIPEGAITHVHFIGPATKRFDVARWKQRIVAALRPRQPDLQVV